MGIIRSSRDQALHVSGPKYLKGKGKQQKNAKTKFEAPKPKVENQQHEEPSGLKKNKIKGHHGVDVPNWHNSQLRDNPIQKLSKLLSVVW